MKMSGQGSALKRERTKKKWWHFLDMPIALLIAIVLTSILLLASLNPSPTQAPQPQHSSGNSMSGLASIAAPLENLFTHDNQSAANDPCGAKEGSEFTKCIQDVLQKCGNDVNCKDLPEACRNIPPMQFQECMDGVTGRDTYQKDDPKIQNPIAKGSSLFFFSPFEITIANTQVNLLWSAMLAIVDAFLVVALLMQGLRVILSGSVFRYARAIEDLPGALLAIIVAHISLLFMVSAIGLGNSMTKYIYTFAEENPVIKRDASGFGSGNNEKELTLRVFFTETGKDKEQYYETTKAPSPADAAKLWPAPDNGAPNGKGTTSEDMNNQFKNKDLVCTWEKSSFDISERDKIFGTSPETSNIYMSVKLRSENLIRHKDETRDDHKFTQDDLNYLQSMAQTIKDDISPTGFGQDALKWYEDFTQFDTDMGNFEKNNFLPTTLDLTTYRDETNAIISASSLLFNGEGRGMSPNGSDMPGDAIIYKCSADATGNTFQLVPDDLNFTDLFKNLQSLTDALPMMRKIMALMLLVQMIVRIFFINLYIVTAPLGIGCSALPGKVGQPVTRLWLQGFLSTVFVQFLMVAALIGIQTLLGGVLSFTAGGDPQNVAGGLDNKSLTNIIYIACLWFVMRIPTLFNTAPMQTMAAAGQMMAQTVGTTISMQVAQFQMEVQAAISVGSIAVSAIAR
ncbi:hypothetical protein [Ktedonospora formicarum]|uniref:Uncharacterized protein n=1 Tax=Ktedonospora formicarum TaxID=2778364 RepID=A0A8J3MQI0_9CHLR|nr:hypothetical protein [Ktedonospora formicarum]GHO42791.1 hypothetical protein KSX_09540 [Ktedonospora formicarum]